MKPKAKNKTNNTVIAIEIHNELIKLCELTVDKQRQKIRLLAKKIPPKDDKEIAKEITEFFKANNIAEKRVLLNLPRHLVIVRFLSVPSTKDEEIREIARMEAIKHVSYSSDEVVVSHRVIDKGKDGYSDVLMCICQKSVISRYIDIARDAGIIIEKIALGSESLLAWYGIVSKSLNMETEERLAVINMDQYYVNIDIITGSKLIFARAFTYSKTALNAAAFEIVKSIISYQYQKPKGIEVKKVLMSGAGPTVLAMEQLLKASGNVTVETIPQTKDIDASYPELNDVSFIELVGLAVHSDDVKLNLLPKEVIEKNQINSIKNLFAETLTLFTVILIALTVLAVSKIYSKSAYLEMLKGEQGSIAADVRKAEKLEKDMKVIKTQILKKNMTIDVIGQIYKITPMGISYSSIDYNEINGTVTLKGLAQTLNDVVKFVPILTKSPFFENAKIKYTAKRTKAQVEVTEFELVCKLKAA